MNVLLMPNLEKPNSVHCTVEAAGVLSRLGALPMLDINLRDAVRIDPEIRCEFGEYFSLLARCDILLPIGGDGTFLHAVQHAVQADRPLLGINTGTVGFLTQLEPAELSQLALLVSGRYTVERRMMLEAEIEQEDGIKSFPVLNDIVLSRVSARVIDITVMSENRMISRNRADGLIFATPTGSTAYSFSAGGCIADPGTELVVLTPICPHSAYNRSLILPADRMYEAAAEDGNADGIYIAADGVRVATLTGAQKVRIRRSKLQAQFINPGIRDFYLNLDEKLSLKR